MDNYVDIAFACGLLVSCPDFFIFENASGRLNKTVEDFFEYIDKKRKPDRPYNVATPKSNPTSLVKPKNPKPPTQRNKKNT